MCFVNPRGARFDETMGVQGIQSPARGIGVLSALLQDNLGYIAGVLPVGKPVQHCLSPLT